MAGIFEEVQMREDIFANNPQALQQRYAQTQELVDLLSLQRVSNLQQAAKNQITAAMQTKPGTRVEQLEQEVLSGARSEVLAELAPGIQQKGQRSMQRQAMMGQQPMRQPMQGMAGIPATNMNGMADGGIVGYAEGELVQEQPSLLQKAKQGLGQSMMGIGSNMQESDQIIRNAMPFITQMLGKGPALTEQERAELKATVEQDPGLIGIFGKQLENLGIYVKDMAGGGIVSFVKGGETGFPDLNKDGEVTQADILMGRGVVGKQEGGIVSFAQGDPVVDPENRLLDLSELVGVTEEDPISVPEAEGRLGDELGAAIESGASSVLDYIKENPVDAASLGLMAVPGGVLARSGLAALSKIPAIRNAVTGAGRLAQKAVTKPRMSGYGSAIRGPKGKFMSAKDAKAAGLRLNRQFDPLRTMGVTGAALGLGNSLLGGDDTEIEEVQDTTVEEIIRKTPPPPPPPKKSGLAGANIDFDMLRQQGAAAAGGTTTGQSLALAGAATGAEQARRETVAEKRRSDQERNAIYAEQVAATLAAGNQRRQAELIKAFTAYMETSNAAQQQLDAASLATLDGLNYDDLPESTQNQYVRQAALNFVQQAAGLGNVAGGIQETPELVAALAKYSGNPRQ